MEYAEFTQVAETAIVTAEVSDLMHGDVILVPGKGKRAVRRHSNGSISLVFPRSGKSENGKGTKAGSLSDLGQHKPAVIGHVTGGWVDGTVAPKAPKASKAQAESPAPKAADPKPRDLRTKEGRAWKARQAKATAEPTVSPLQTAILEALGHMDAATECLRRAVSA